MPKGYSWEEKEFRTEDGTLYEEVPMHRTAFHHDDELVVELARAVCKQAAKDWWALERKKERKAGDRAVRQSVGGQIYRTEVARFFNSSFFGDIIGVLFPDVEQEEAIQSMINARGYRMRGRHLEWA